MATDGIDRSRLKVTSRQQIAYLRARRFHERQWRDVRTYLRLYRKVRLAAFLIGTSATIAVVLLRAWDILPPLP